MKFVRICNNSLFAVHYPDKKNNELEILLENWNNQEFIINFISSNYKDAPKGISKIELTERIMDDAEKIEDALDQINSYKNTPLDVFFKPLENERYVIQSLIPQKGRENYLRIYAIKIESNCFVITGGAIKFHHLMKDRPHTQTELYKLQQCRSFLKENGISDKESFLELLI